MGEQGLNRLLRVAACLLHNALQLIDLLLITHSGKQSLHGSDLLKLLRPASFVGVTNAQPRRQWAGRNSCVTLRHLFSYAKTVLYSLSRSASERGGFTTLLIPPASVVHLFASAVAPAIPRLALVSAPDKPMFPKPVTASRQSRSAASLEIAIAVGEPMGFPNLADKPASVPFIAAAPGPDT